MKKILVVSECPTHPVTAGNRSCQLAYCELLIQMGYEVFFLYVNADSGSPSNAMRQYWAKRIFVYERGFIIKYWRKVMNRLKKNLNRSYLAVDDFYSFGLTKYINNINLECNFDAVIVNYVWMSRVFKGLNIENKILFTHDCFSHKALHTNTKIYSLTPSQESKGLRRCDKILAIQQNEAAYFRFLAPLSKIFVVYSPFSLFDTPCVNTKNILFFSGSNIFNINGISKFISEVWPLVLKKDPEVKLLIGGKLCGCIKDKFIDNNVFYYGETDDCLNFYQQGNIAINPVYQGTGLKIKTFEALSYGKVVITNPHSAEGVFKKNGSPIIIADNPTMYAEQILRFVQNPCLCGEYKLKAYSYLNEMNEYIKQTYKSCIES